MEGYIKSVSVRHLAKGGWRDLAKIKDFGGT